MVYIDYNLLSDLNNDMSFLAFAIEKSANQWKILQYYREFEIIGVNGSK